MDALSAPVITAIVVVATTLVCGLIGFLNSPAAFSLKDRVVVVTGGSSGIGQEVALSCLQAGAHVVLLARDQGRLEAAAGYLQAQLAAHQLKHPQPQQPKQLIRTYSADVTDAAATAAALELAAKECGGVIHGLVCSAGTSSPKEFVSQTAAEFEQVLRLNVVGTRNAIAAALPFMNDKAGGRIVLISSQAGQVGLYGYTAYSVRGARWRCSLAAQSGPSDTQHTALTPSLRTPHTPHPTPHTPHPHPPQSSKFALNGLAQSLSMELAPRRILLSLSFPPDTDTPLLAEENKSKPAITRALSAATTTVQPQVVAAGIVAGMTHYSPTISVGFDGWMLSTLTAGMGPAGSWWSAVVQVATMGLWRAVALFYVQDFYSTVMKGSKGQ